LLQPRTSCPGQARAWLDDKGEFTVTVDTTDATGYHPITTLMQIVYDNTSRVWRPTHKGIQSMTGQAELDAKKGGRTVVRFPIDNNSDYVYNLGPGDVRQGDWITCVFNPGNCRWEATPGAGGDGLTCIELSQELRGESSQTALGFTCDGVPGTKTVTPVRFRGYLFPGQTVDCLPPDPQEGGDAGNTDSAPYIAIGGGGCHYIHGTLATTLGRRGYGYVNTPLGLIQVFGRYGGAQNGTEIGCLWNAGTKFWDAALQACDDNNSGGF
jgi:hypothetical protein